VCVYVTFVCRETHVSLSRCDADLCVCRKGRKRIIRISPIAGDYITRHCIRISPIIGREGDAHCECWYMRNVNKTRVFAYVQWQVKMTIIDCYFYLILLVGACVYEMYSLSLSLSTDPSKRRCIPTRRE
jgi:hypothetical protein